MCLRRRGRISSSQLAIRDVTRTGFKSLAVNICVPCQPHQVKRMGVHRISEQNERNLWGWLLAKMTREGRKETEYHKYTFNDALEELLKEVGL